MIKTITDTRQEKYKNWDNTMPEVNNKIGTAEEQINKQKNRLRPCFKGIRKAEQQKITREKLM